MKNTLGIVSGVLMLLAFADMGIAAVAAIHVNQGNLPLPDGGAGGLLLMFLAGAVLKWRERY